MKRSIFHALCLQTTCASLPLVPFCIEIDSFAFEMSWVRRSNVRVMPHRNNSQKSVSARCLKNYLTNFNQTWQARVMVTAHCVATTQLQKVKG